jgi:hypothetical protein
MMFAEAERVEDEVNTVRSEQKRLVAALSEKGGVPDGVPAGSLSALLTLHDSSS